ncbi:hypothetical protein CPC08DRAFT_816890 [Agrocybe pediades]|nr:hypothetical protein CPC08DRAFT_816890 [Agrocybe pediades]
MQTIAFHVGKLAPRIFTPCTRFFTTTRCLKARTERNEVSQYIANLAANNRRQIWPLVSALETPRDRIYLHEALQDNRVTATEYDTWMEIVDLPDIGKAVSALRSAGYLVDKDTAPRGPIPPWVVLTLLAYRVKDPMQASGPMMDLVFSQLPLTMPIIQGPLLILAAFHLARSDLLIPLRRVLDAFLVANLYQEEKQFNDFLRALSTVPYRSVESTRNVLKVIKVMDERQLQVRGSTYEALLNKRCTTLPMAKHLFIHMMKGGMTPTAQQLESFLRTFTRLGRPDFAKQIYAALQRVTGGPADENGMPSDDHRSRANTLMLNSFASIKKASSFLAKLVDTVSDTVGEETDTSDPAAKSLLARRSRNNIADATATLHIAAKDTKVSVEKLLNLFNSIPHKPTIATHTVLIKGLLIRKDYKKAVIFWSKIAKQSTLRMDEEALAAGLYAFTLYQRPHEAFQLLEKYAARPGEGPTDVQRDEGIVPIQISTIAINEYLVALNRVSRPDAVFRLWEYMGTLYGTHPNAMSLAVLLQSARLAHKMDDSLPGVLARFGLINPFRSTRSTDPKDERIHAVDAVITCIGHPSRGNLRRYRSGLWRDQEPVEFARKIFLQCLFGNDTQGKLLSVKSPARACRKSYDDDGSSSSIGLPNFSPKEYVFEPPPDLLTPEGTTRYPQIVVNNAHCFNYITLIGTGGRAAEIPLVLAWMRTIGIQPSDSTLAVALTFWAEISVQAPLVEKWNGGPEQNEYTKLVDWIKDWVGEERLPDDELMQKWRGIVTKMRTPRR